MADQNGQGKPGHIEKYISEIGRGDSLELAQTLNRATLKKDGNRTGVTKGEAIKSHEKSFESDNPMPERYDNQHDSIQNMNQVQDLLDVVEKEKELNKQAAISANVKFTNEDIDG